MNAAAVLRLLADVVMERDAAPERRLMITSTVAFLSGTVPIVEDLGIRPWADLGATALLSLCVVLILTGRLKPKADVDHERKQSAAWQAQAQAAIRELATIARAVEKQAEAKELSVALLESVRKEGEK